MKKIISLLLAAVLIASYPMFAFADTPPSDGTTAEAQRFNSDGSYKIMQITDTHMADDDILPATMLFLKKMVDDEKPDLVTITGDIAMSGTIDDIKYCINCLMSIFEERDIPVAVVFGNHDSEKGLISREDLMAVYNSYDCSISVDDGDLLPGCGTYNIPIMASDSDRIAFNIWMVDSRDYDSEDHYGYVTTEQVDWYKAKSDALKSLNGGQPVNSLVFQHIIVPEIYDALEKRDRIGLFTYEHIYNDGEYYRLNPDNTNSGVLFEYPCPGYYNMGQFRAMVEKGDVLAMFFGHDHSNTFNITYEGIDLVNTPKTIYRPDVVGAQRGVRIIELNENDTSTYTDRVLTFGEVYGLSDLAAIAFSDSENKPLELKVASTMIFMNFFVKIFYNYLIKVPEFLAGRKFCF